MGDGHRKIRLGQSIGNLHYTVALSVFDTLRTPRQRFPQDLANTAPQTSGTKPNPAVQGGRSGAAERLTLTPEQTPGLQRRCSAQGHALVCYHFLTPELRVRNNRNRLISVDPERGNGYDCNLRRRMVRGFV